MILFVIKNRHSEAILTQPLSALECEQILAKLGSTDYEICEVAEQQKTDNQKSINQMDLFQ